MFLEYDATFIPWLLRHAGRRLIVDVGSGEGGLLRDLHAAGCTRLLGIDFRDIADEDVAALVLVQDATESPVIYMGNTLLVIARPCHGGWVDQVIRTTRSEVLLLTRESTLKGDLGEPTLLRAEHFEVPGLQPAADGEPILAWRFRAMVDSRPQSWWLVQPGGMTEPEWYQRAESLGPRGRPWTVHSSTAGYWVNSAGGGFEAWPEKDIILEGPVIADELELDWARTPRIARMLEEAHTWPPVYLTGWLSPAGEFWACAYKDHDTLAFYGMGFEVRDLENLGYARVQVNTNIDVVLAYRRDEKPLTEAQEAKEKQLQAYYDQREE